MTAGKSIPNIIENLRTQIKLPTVRLFYICQMFDARSDYYCNVNHVHEEMKWTWLMLCVIQRRIPAHLLRNKIDLCVDTGFIGSKNLLGEKLSQQMTQISVMYL